MTTSPLDDRIRDAIKRLLASRADTATICPSEAARDVEPADWRGLMPRVRDVALAMTRAGEIEITQGGRVLSITKPLRGPIRLRTAKR